MLTHIVLKMEEGMDQAAILLNNLRHVVIGVVERRVVAFVFLLFVKSQ